ncbi:extracellular solute-binding protein [Streptomyces sp. NPDC102360]|uniref:sugar ABC transporter substrate-binding protein n=1 Tax=Streptomyces sp. NPDC102360 TaxID=3366160 RepID=UPI00382F5774
MVRRTRAGSRATAATALILGTSLAVSACSGTEPDTSSSGKVTRLRVLDYYNNEPDKTVYAKLLKACGRENGVTIEREVVPGSALIPKVLQQGSSHTMPDVLMLDNPDLQQIAATGALTPLSDYGLSADGYAKGVVDASSYRGRLYGLQPVANTLGLFYDKDALKKAGVTPPATWRELRAAAQKLRTKDRYGVAFAAPAGYEGAFQFLPFLWSAGGDERNIATPSAARALDLWADMVKDGSASKSVVNWTQADVNDQFAAGNAAMMINGPWQFPVLDSTPGRHYGVVPVPVPRSGEGVVAPLGGETWTLPKTDNVERQKRAARVVKCLNSDKSQLSLAERRQTVPTRTALSQRFEKQEPAMRPFVRQVRDARARTGKLGSAWPRAALRIYTAIQSALAAGEPPARALKEAQDG